MTLIYYILFCIWWQKWCYGLNLLLNNPIHTLKNINNEWAVSFIPFFGSFYPNINKQKCQFFCNFSLIGLAFKQFRKASLNDPLKARCLGTWAIITTDGFVWKQKRQGNNNETEVTERKLVLTSTNNKNPNYSKTIWSRRSDQRQRDSNLGHFFKWNSTGKKRQ